MTKVRRILRNNLPPSEQMRVLFPAYACAPVNGSEEGVGRNTAVAVSRLCSVSVVTSTKHRAKIEPGSADWVRSWMPKNCDGRVEYSS